MRLIGYDYYIVVLLTEISTGLAVREAMFGVYNVKYNLRRLSYLDVTGKQNGIALRMLSCGFL